MHFLKVVRLAQLLYQQSDPNVVYVGTGQSTIRGNVSVGVGIYKSLDGGKKWTHTGLRKAGQIGRIVIHPEIRISFMLPCLEILLHHNEERGLYRSKNGGKDWEKILNISPKTGLTIL